MQPQQQTIGEMPFEQLDGPDVTADHDHLGPDLVARAPDGIGDLVGMALPGALGALLDLPLLPASGLDLADGPGVVGVDVGVLLARSDAEGGDVGAAPVGEHHHIGHGVLTPTEQRAEDREPVPPPDVGGQRFGTVFHVQESVGGGERGEGGAELGGGADERCHVLQRPGVRAPGRQLAPEVVPVQVGELRRALEVAGSVQVDRDHRAPLLGERPDLGRVHTDGQVLA